jgi:hypothetical protein
MTHISSEETKVWFDVKQNKAIFVQGLQNNHTQDVLNNPENYRVPSDAFKDIDAVYDYDGRVLYKAMQAGFVRIRIEYKDPQYGSNIEGINLRDIQKACIWLEKFVGGLKKVIIVVRTGEGDKDGQAYVLNNEEQIEFMIKYGKILRDRF